MSAIDTFTILLITVRYVCVYVTVYWSFGAVVCYIIGGVLLIVPFTVLKIGAKATQKQL